MNPYKNAGIYVGSRCDLTCPKCIQRPLRDLYPAGDMTREQFDRILYRLKYLNWPLHTVTLTGGEARLWPHYRWSLVQLRQIADRIRVLTNGADCRPEDFEDVDEVVVSNYGGISREGFARLRRILGRKVVMSNPVHLEWPPEKPVTGKLPAMCFCVMLQFAGDQVRPCPFSPYSLSVEEDFVAQFQHFAAREQDACRTCLMNYSVRAQVTPPPTVELAVWDSSIWRTWSLRRNHLWLKSLTTWLRRCVS